MIIGNRIERKSIVNELIGKTGEIFGIFDCALCNVLHVLVVLIVELVK